MTKKHYTNEQKRKAAVMAIRNKANGGGYSEVADLVGCHMTMIGKWVDAYRLGKFDEKPEASNITTESKALKEIDIRPELKSIPKAIDKLSSMVERACIRLDAIYVELTERKGLSEIEETEPLELDDDDFIDGLKKQNGVD